MEDGFMEYRDQPTFGVSYAHKLEKSEAEIDWRKNVEVFATKYMRCHLRRVPVLKS